MLFSLASPWANIPHSATLDHLSHRAAVMVRPSNIKWQSLANTVTKKFSCVLLCPHIVQSWGLYNAVSTLYFQIWVKNAWLKRGMLRCINKTEERADLIKSARNTILENPFFVKTAQTVHCWDMVQKTKVEISIHIKEQRWRQRRGKVHNMTW